MTDRELDALVAEKVMGLGAVSEHGGQDLQGRELLCYAEAGNKCAGIVPHYSTEIAAAWEVVEKIKDMDEFCISLWFDGVWNTKIDVLQPQDDGPSYIGPITHKAEDDFAPWSICLAALKAFGVEAA